MQITITDANKTRTFQGATAVLAQAAAVDGETPASIIMEDDAGRTFRLDHFPRHASFVLYALNRSRSPEYVEADRVEITEEKPRAYDAGRTVDPRNAYA